MLRHILATAFAQFPGTFLRVILCSSGRRQKRVTTEVVNIFSRQVRISAVGALLRFSLNRRLSSLFLFLFFIAVYHDQRQQDIRDGGKQQPGKGTGGDQAPRDSR